VQRASELRITATRSSLTLMTTVRWSAATFIDKASATAETAGPRPALICYRSLLASTAQRFLT
jgi:hypothetical protein